MVRKGTVISVTLKLIICFVICSCIMLPLPKYAYAEGGINDNEARVIAEARGTFEYEGETYVAKQSYVDQLIGQFSAEGVDLTSEQADRAIATIRSNVGTGVMSGYLVKAGSPGDDQQKEPGDDDPEEPPKQTEQKDDSKKPDDKNDIDNTDNKDDKNDEPLAALTTGSPSVNENDDGTLTVTDEEGKTILQFEGVLRNTGFSYQGTVILIIMLGVIISCVLIYSVMVMKDTNKR